MENNKGKEVSMEELKNKLKIAKTVTGIFAGALLILIFATLYLAFTKKFTPLTIVPLALLPLLMININSINKLKTEIQSSEISK